MTIAGPVEGRGDAVIGRGVARDRPATEAPRGNSELRQRRHQTVSRQLGATAAATPSGLAAARGYRSGDTERSRGSSALTISPAAAEIPYDRG
jgi:hypothetical protein